MPAWPRRPILVACTVLGLALGAAPTGGRTAPVPSCNATPELLDAAPLPGTSVALNRGTLRVMVVGSASIQGGGTSAPTATWP